MINMVKLPTNKSNLFLRVAKGHFATSHSHINYYIDVTTQKSRLSEAKAVAKELVAAYQHNTIVDTVLCLDRSPYPGWCRMPQFPSRIVPLTLYRDRNHYDLCLNTAELGYEKAAEILAAAAK